MNYLQGWMAERIADRIRIIAVSKPSKRALRKKTSLIGSYIQMRTAYGAMHHWPLDETNTDIDIYDYNPETEYFLSMERGRLGRSRLTAGLRLTRITDFDKSLSLSMWANAVDKKRVAEQLIRHKQDIAILKLAARKGNVWDLTRLVTAMSLQAERSPKTKRATYAALLIMLGAAMKRSGPDSFWIFTTNREVRRFLEKLGIQYTMLAHGRIGYSDAGESYFAWTSAPAAYQQLQSQPIVAQLVTRGYARGAVRQSGGSSVS